MSTFTARYRGVCADCREQVEPGQEVTYGVDDKLVHADCDAVELPGEKPSTVCPDCWMAVSVSGACGCDA